MSRDNKEEGFSEHNYDVTDLQNIQRSESDRITTYQCMDIDSTLEDLTRLRLSSELDTVNAICEDGNSNESIASRPTQCPVSPERTFTTKLSSTTTTEDSQQQQQQQQQQLLFSSYPTCRDQSSNPNTTEIIINTESNDTIHNLDDTTVEDIAGYLEQLEILSRNMSSMAKMMYS